MAAGRSGVNDLSAAGDGSTTAGIAAATGKTIQSVRGSMNTAAKHFLVVNKPDKTQKGKKAIDRWFLIKLGLADDDEADEVHGDGLQGEDEEVSGE